MFFLILLFFPLVSFAADNRNESDVYREYISRNTHAIISQGGHIQSNTNQLLDQSIKLEEQEFKLDDHLRKIKENNSSVKDHGERIAHQNGYIEDNKKMINALNRELSETHSKLKAAISGVIAISSIPQDLRYEDNIGVGIGTYGGEHAIAIKINHNLNFNLKTSIASSIDSQNGVSFGAGLSVGF